MGVGGLFIALSQFWDQEGQS